MARWKTLLLAGALGCWPALGFAQGNLPVPPAAPGGDQGVPALPPGANTSVASVPVAVVGSSTTAPTASRPARVSLSDMNGSRGSMMPSGMPDVSGMPKPEGQMMYTGMGMNPMMGGGDVQNSFIPAGANNFCCQPPVGVEPCGTTIQAKGPCGVLFEAGLTWNRVRRSDPDVLYLAPNAFGGTDVVQSDLNSKTGLGWYAGAGYLTADGWYGMVTYRKYTDTIQSSTIENNTAPEDNFTLFYTGPGPLGSGQGGNDVPAGGSLTTNYTFNWTNLDIMGGTVISPARCLDVIFAGGVRISKLEQTYDAFINKGDGSSTAQALYTRLQGAGPRIGMEARVYPLQPLTLYAKTYTSILYTNRLEQAVTLFGDVDGGVTANTSTYTREELLPVLELAVGADVSLFGGRVIAGAGYNFNYLFEAGSTYTDQSTNSRTARHVNLTVDGIELHVTLLW